MKKIININLAGRVVPIEDSAYETLQRYIESLRRYFAGEEGRDEIINDIESRIAELMNDKIRKGAGSVTDADIEEIISSMGRVEDFEAEDEKTVPSTEEQQSADYEHTTQTKKPRGRLYRDTSDKFLGGVCSGIANYLNVDPAMVRLLFAIIAAGSFGFGFLMYVFLWIFVPARNLDTYVGKRLFRNPDDQIIGGVCGGLAAYFNRSSKTMRLIFAAPLLLNIFLNALRGLLSWGYFENFTPFDLFFGSITSTFILVYIVLWIVLPLARSPFEKMEMRGEKVDVNRIRQNVQQNLSDLESKARAWGAEAADAASRFGQKAKEFASTRGKTWTEEAKPVARGIGHAIGVLIKAFLLFVFGTLAFALFVGLMVLIFGGGSVLWPLKQALMEFVLDGPVQKGFFWGTLVFFIAVPIVAFMTWLIRRIMRVRSQKSHLGWIFGGLWTIGWICLIVFLSLLSHDFRSDFESDPPEEVSITQPVDGKMILAVSGPAIRSHYDFMFTDIDNRGWDFTDDSLKLANVHLEFDRSNDSNYHVSIIRQSRGKDFNHAKELAEKIQFHVSSHDSTLDLGSHYAIARSDKFRGQNVIVLIQVPVGKKIRFHASVAEKLSPHRFEMRRHRRAVSLRYRNHYIFGYRTDIDYTMDATGKLRSDEDLRRKEEEEQRRIDNSYRTDDVNQGTPDSIDRLIQEKERKLREEQRSLEELRRMKGQRTGYERTIELKDPLFLPSAFYLI